jgi:hypothetical protein
MGSRVRIRITPDDDTTTTPRLPRPRIRIEPQPVLRARRAVSTKPSLTILDAVQDEHLFKPFFKNPQSWATWFAILAAIFALPMDAEQVRLYSLASGRTGIPTSVAKEVWLVIGRRGGKSRILALIAVWLACFHDHSEHLSPGELGVVQIIAADRRQAKVILRYIKAFLTKVPMLSPLVESEREESVTLTNGIIIEVTTGSFRSVRGRTVVAALCDEIAFWLSDESANPDTEVLAAIRPSMATIPNSMLLCASSPYARRGALYAAHAAHYGKNGDSVLVFQAASKLVNPLIDQSIIDDAYNADPVSASAEYGAEFRSDLEAFVSLDTIMACVSLGMLERPPESETKYVAFMDPAGGSGKDSFTLAIAHKDKASDLVVLDAIRETKPPFSPEVVVETYSKLLQSYGIKSAISDRYGGEWLKSPFEKAGVTVEPSERAKSDLYRDALPQINGKKVDLLDHPRMIQQFVGLERRTARSGRDSIDHAPGAHDDLCNVVAGVIANIDVKKYAYDVTMAWADSLADDSSNRTVEMLSRFAASQGRYLR